MPLSVRSNLTGGFFFKQSNQKRIQLLREEYMSFMSNGEYKKFEKFCWNAASIQRHLRAHRASSTSISSSQDTYPPPLSGGIRGMGQLPCTWRSAPGPLAVRCQRHSGF